MFKLSARDGAWMLAGVLLTYAISLRLGGGHLLWEDEVLGWVMLRDPSWSHMLYGWRHGADGGGAFFYVTGRLWFALFGDSDLSFRAYSATLYGIAFVLLWTLVRRFYSSAAALVGFLIGWFIVPSLVPHMAEGRFYGLLMATTAAAALWVVLRVERPRRTAGSYLATFALFSLLVTSHMLGICYCGALLLAWWAGNSVRGGRHWAHYFIGAASALWLLPSLPAIQASAAVGKPHFWTSQPTPLLFMLAYVGSSLRAAAIVSALLLLLAVATVLRRRRPAPPGCDPRQRVPILAVLGALYLMPVVFLLEGFVGTPLFDNRYLQPVCIGTVILACELVTQSQLRWLGERRRALVTALFATPLVLLTLHYDFFYHAAYATTQRDYTAALKATLPAGVPVVCEDAFTFTELMHKEAGSDVRYLFLLDWDNAVSAAAPRLEVTQFHLMQNWQRAGYFADHVVERDSFLETHPYFLVLHTDTDPPARLLHAGEVARQTLIGNPLTARFAQDARYRTLPFSRADLESLHQIASLVCRQDLDCEAVRRQLRDRAS